MIVVHEFNIEIWNQAEFLKHLPRWDIDSTSRRAYGHGFSLELLDPCDSLCAPHLEYIVLQVCAKIFDGRAAQPRADDGSIDIKVNLLGKKTLQRYRDSEDLHFGFETEFSKEAGFGRDKKWGECSTR